MLPSDRVAELAGASRTALGANIGKLALIGTGLAFLTILVLLPLAWTLQYAFSNGATVFWRSISSPEAVSALKFTLLIAVLTTLINAVMGTVLTFVLVRHDFPLKGMVDSLVDLPLAVPAAVTGATLVLLYGPVGFTARMFQGTESGIVLMFSGVLVAHVFVTLPYVVRAVAPILAEVDIRQEEVARAMGANGVQLFTGVILPAIRSGLISGSAFTFVRSVGELGATIMVLGSLAPRTQTAPTFILSALSQGGTEEAAAMAVLLVMISLALFLGLKLAVTAAERRERRWSAR